MYNVNGWISVSPLEVDLVVGDNTIDCSAYIKLVPVADGCRVVGFHAPPVVEAGIGWIMEVANSSSTMNVLLVSGEPDQYPDEMVMNQSPGGITLPPSSSQRLYYSFGTGWVPLLPASSAS